MINSTKKTQDAMEVLTRLSNRFLYENGPQVTIEQENQITHFKKRTQEDFISLKVEEAGKSINDLLTTYCAGETVKFRLEGTKDVVDMRKTLSIASMPKVLQLQIQRMGIHYAEERENPKTKEKETVLHHAPFNPNVPEFLNLRPFLTHPDLNVPSVYRLDSIICRSGENTSEASGHNWFIKREGNKWTKFDDGRVTEHTLEQLQDEFNKNAYGLFYEKVQIKS